MNTDRLHVYYTVDERYIEPAKVSIYSFLKYNRLPITVYLVNCKSSNEYMRFFQDFQITTVPLYVNLLNQKYSECKYRYCFNEIMSKHLVISKICSKYDYALHLDADTYFNQRIDFENIDMIGYDCGGTYYKHESNKISPQCGFTIFKTHSGLDSSKLETLLAEYYKQFPPRKQCFENPEYTGVDEKIIPYFYKKIKRLDQVKYNSTTQCESDTVMYHMDSSMKPWHFVINPYVDNAQLLRRIDSLQKWYNYMNEIKDYLDQKFIHNCEMTKCLCEKLKIYLLNRNGREINKNLLSYKPKIC